MLPLVSALRKQVGHHFIKIFLEIPVKFLFLLKNLSCSLRLFMFPVSTNPLKFSVFIWCLQALGANATITLLYIYFHVINRTTQLRAVGRFAHHHHKSRSPTAKFRTNSHPVFSRSKWTNPINHNFRWPRTFKATSKLIVYINWNLTYTTKKGNRVGGLA